MSLKRQLQAQARSLALFFYSLRLPRWLNGFTMRAVLVSLSLLFVVLYLGQLTQSSTYGYTLHELERQSEALRTENQKLTIETAHYGSMANIQKRLAGMRMVAAEDIKHLDANRAVVVAKK